MTLPPTETLVWYGVWFFIGCVVTFCGIALAAMVLEARERRKRWRR